MLQKLIVHLPYVHLGWVVIYMLKSTSRTNLMIPAITPGTIVFYMLGKFIYDTDRPHTLWSYL